ncbi:MAG: galactitol-1-phosphate 5-dehydrogenase [Lachnospiraceae bacterium]|nr:galactitol-1-phosphate 5-dehydrogenase [Lachnospiraceae bacterium]
MKAFVLEDIGDIRFEDVSLPKLKENEVLVKVGAVGICGSDIPRIYKTGAYCFPLIPGHEFAGTVVEAGSAAPASWVGKRVGIFPLIPCKECVPCQKQQYEMCRHYSYLGSRRDGGFAEYVAVPVENLLELPDNVTLQAAAMLEPMAVAVHAMRRLSLNCGDTVAVCGLGTIGLLLVMFLKEAGIEKVYVVGNKEFQKEKVLSLGIPEEDYCDSRSGDVEKWLLERTGGMGVDAFFECVGKNETVRQAIALTAPGGKIQLVGNPYSEMLLEKELYWKILRHQLIITGTWNSSFTGSEQDDWHYVLDRLKAGRVSPEEFISHELTFTELEKGFHIMRDKTEDYVKIMAVFDAV